MINHRWKEVLPMSYNPFRVVMSALLVATCSLSLFGCMKKDTNQEAQVSTPLPSVREEMATAHSSQKTDLVVPGAAPSTVSLRKVLKDDFLIGTAINPDQLTGPSSELLLRQFNSITAENAMKMDALHPSENVFQFTDADRLISFAQENHLAVRGHTLVWHSQVPDWIFVDEAGNDVSKEVLLARMKKHIQTIVSRYKGKVGSWDVLNEIIEPLDGREDGLRNTKWLQIIGKEYIEKALIYAHEADPKAKLYINDYGTTDYNKRQFLYNLVKSLKERNIPIDGVGHQMHLDIDKPSVGSIDQTISMFSELGLDTQITELDMNMYTNEKVSFEKVSDQMLILQANRYKQIFEVFLKHREHISSVTFWGMSDDRTWLRYFPVERNNWPLLFDEELQTKPAFWSIASLRNP